MDPFVAIYLGALAVLFICGFVWICQRHWEIPASIIVIIVCSLLFLIIPPGGAEEIAAINTNEVYVRVGIVNSVDEDGVIHIIDGAGVEWLWEKEEDDEFEEDDIVGFLVQRTGNPDSIYDDCILNVYYGGIII